MQAQLQTQLAFHLTGRKPGAGLDAVESLGLRPVLLASYRDLTRLRYDFPLVLLDAAAGRPWVQCLSALLDGVVHEIAQTEDASRLTQHVLRLEQAMRAVVAAHSGASLWSIWERAASRLAAGEDELLQDSLRRARAALKFDGEVLDCNKSMPLRFLNHAWATVQRHKAGKFLEGLERLMLKLSDIIGADDAHSTAARSPESLKSALGPLHAEAFDFDAMSRVLGKVSAQALLPASRRRRILDVLEVLSSQRFHAGAKQRAAGRVPYTFVFENCSSALEAYRQRLPEVLALARAMAIARLESEGEYREGTHDAFFDAFGAENLDQDILAGFPDYLVCLNAETLQAGEHSILMEILSGELPMKVLLQTDDILHESALGDGHLAVGLRNKQLTNAAIGLNEVYVLQAAGSHLFQFRDRVLKGMTYSGPALFSVYSGASGTTGGLSPYLTAAAATESRAFAAFVYDPSAGPNWASRFYLDGNAQVDSDWPEHEVVYEDEEHQRLVERVAFTVIDFLACDQRLARHFARVPRATWNGGLISVGEYLARSEPKSVPDKVPTLLMSDDNNVLQRVIVDGRLMREAQRCRDNWHNLQELAGIHNSHAERLLARERKAWEEQAQRQAANRSGEAAAVTAVSLAAAPAPAAATVAAEAEVEDKKSSDEAYIETPRCTTCNECTQINDKMFAYNENKQAYIADPAAGTYAQLVEAAETCQVAIIHPGKPRNPNEPGLEELMKRAELFQ